jgi:hypothetical protein
MDRDNNLGPVVLGSNSSDNVLGPIMDQDNDLGLLVLGHYLTGYLSQDYWSQDII